MYHPLFDELKKYYAAHPEKLDSLTREEFEKMISCKKEEKEYDNIIRFGYYSSDHRALCV